MNRSFNIYFCSFKQFFSTLAELSAKFRGQLQSGKNKENMAARDVNTNEESLEPRVRSPDRKRYKMDVNLGCLTRVKEESKESQIERVKKVEYLPFPKVMVVH